MKDKAEAPAASVPRAEYERERNLRLGAEATKEMLERERTAHLQFLAEHNFGAFDALRKNAEAWRQQYSQALARAEAAEWLNINRRKALDDLKAWAYAQESSERQLAEAASKNLDRNTASKRTFAAEAYLAMQAEIVRIRALGAYGADAQRPTDPSVLADAGQGKQEAATRGTSNPSATLSEREE